MAGDGSTKQRQERRPADDTARLERMRQRNADQLEAQRVAERRVEDALTAYLDADASISGVERTRNEKISGLQQQIDQVSAAAQAELEQIRQRQAVAVWQLKDAGRTVEQITDLLELPPKQTRQLLAAGRTAATSEDSGTDSAPADPPTPDVDKQPTPSHPAETSAQREPDGVAGQQNGTTAPSAPDPLG